MNDQNPPIDPLLPDEHGAPIEEMPIEAPRRAASLTLRSEEDPSDRVASLEAANQSLSDALGIAYRGLQIVMVLLVVAFVFSGFQQVDQSEQGLRIRFGEIQDGVVEPGAHLSWPRGFGEIVRTGLTQQQIQLQRRFMPDRYDPTRDIDAQGVGTQNLTPGRDGYLLTADDLIVHAQADFTYRRTDIRDYNINVHPDHERDIMEALIRRAMVHACAERTFDELLSRGSLSSQIEPSDDQTQTQAPVLGSLEGRLRESVNRAIDEASYGISVDGVSVGLITPPLRARSSFRAVVQSESRARSLLEQARERARAELNRAAGTAARPLIALIGEYERLYDLEGEEAAQPVLDRINAIFDGRLNSTAVTVLGTTYPDVTLGGEASEIVSAARLRGQTMGDGARRQAETFEAKLAQYRANPELFLIREWTEAMNAFLARPSVQTYFVPTGVEVVNLMLNNDPDVAREMERAALLRRFENTPGIQEGMDSALMQMFRDEER